MEHIGKKIKLRREELGITQEELATMLGYKNKSTIAKIENGTNDIVQSKVVAFAEALQTTPAFLMGWLDEEDGTKVVATGKITLYKVKIENEDEADVIIEYRRLSDSGKTRVKTYMQNLINLESAESEFVNAAHDNGATKEQEEHANSIMQDDSEWK